MSSYEDYEWVREDREAEARRRFEDDEHRADMEIEARERFTERDYRTPKERMG